MRTKLNYLVCFKTLLLFYSLFCFSGLTYSQEDIFKSQQLPRSTPTSENVDEVILEEFIRSLDSQFEGIHSVMVLRNGKVICEGWWSPYQSEDNHMLFSLSKIFTSTAVGMAVEEGHIAIDDTVADYFPKDLLMILTII